MTTVYLAGPINGCTDEEMHDWRNDLTKHLTGFDVLSPVVRDYRGREDENVKAIVEGDKADVQKSNIVVAYCPRPSVGTSMEVFYVWLGYKHVIVFAPPGAPISPWLRYHSHAVCHTRDEVVAECHAAAQTRW